MAYTVKPDPDDFLSQSQKDIKKNFEILQDSFGLDHVTYSNIDNRGEHKKITYNDFITPPASAGNKSHEMTINVADTPASNIASQLHYQPVIDTGPGTEIVPLSPKMICQFIFNGSTGSQTILTGAGFYKYNVISINANSTNTFVCTFEKPVDTTNYHVQAMVEVPAGFLESFTYGTRNQQIGQFGLLIKDNNNGGLKVNYRVRIMVY